MLQCNNYLDEAAAPLTGCSQGPKLKRTATDNEGEKIMGIIIWLIVGAIAGWLAGMVVRGGGFGLIGDIIVGIVGSLIAGWLLPQIGFPLIGGAFVGAIIDAFIGAVILLIILRLIKRA